MEKDPPAPEPEAALAEELVADAVDELLADVAARRNHRVVLARLRQVRELLDAASFALVQERADALLAGDTVTIHGYNPRLDTLEVDQWARLAELGSELERRGLTWFVVSGTLLGIVRHDGFVPTDDDLDIAVLLDADSDASAAAAWLDVRARLADLLRTQEHERGAEFDLDGPTIDLFPAWIDAAHRLHVWPWCRGEAPGSALLPLARREVGGVQVPLPADPATLLAVNYGDWETPDPLFAFDWPEAHRRFAGWKAGLPSG